MSFVELKEQVARLSAEERSLLADFLVELDETEYRAEINRRMRAMDAGKKVTAEQMEKLHKELLAKGL